MFDRVRRWWDNRQDARHKFDITSQIERHGWTGIYVGDYSNAPTWAYTIGFRKSLGAPEIIVFDIPQASANGLFHEAYRQIKAGELVLADGEPWGPEGDGRVVWRRVHPSRFEDGEQPWLGLAVTWDALSGAQQSEFEAYQLVLSDPNQRLPWEEGYDERLRSLQRALYEPA